MVWIVAKRAFIVLRLSQKFSVYDSPDYASEGTEGSVSAFMMNNICLE